MIGIIKGYVIVAALTNSVKFYDHARLHGAKLLFLNKFRLSLDRCQPHIIFVSLAIIVSPLYNNVGKLTGSYRSRSL